MAEEIKPRWKVGDTLTYKPKSKCKHPIFGEGHYHFGGADQGGHKGTIVEYRGLVSKEVGCEIKVTIPGGGEFVMVERDFEEWETSTPKPAPKFKVGDSVTYKSRSACPAGMYYFSGSDQGGFQGVIRSYRGYMEERKCYEISVTIKGGGSYGMLEDEFIEWDISSSTATVARKFFNQDITVSGYTHNGYTGKVIAVYTSEVTLEFLVEHDNWHGGHGGGLSKKDGIILGHYEDHGKSRWWYSKDELQLGTKTVSEPVKDASSTSSLKFNVGDFVEIVKSGSGVYSKKIGTRVVIMAASPKGYGSAPGYKVSPVEGTNSEDGSYGGFCGEDSFKLIKKATDKYPGMSYKFKVGDTVKIKRGGDGVPASAKGTLVKIIGYSKYLSGPGYYIDKPIGNMKSGSLDCAIGEESFESVEDVSKSIHKYKVGDYVFVEAFKLAAKIVGLDISGSYLIEFNTNRNVGHHGASATLVDGTKLPSHSQQGWYARQGELKLITEDEYNALQDYKIGTPVKYRDSIGKIRAKTEDSLYLVEFIKDFPGGHSGAGHTYERGSELRGDSKKGYLVFPQFLTEITSSEHDRALQEPLDTSGGMSFSGDITVSGNTAVGFYTPGVDVAVDSPTISTDAHSTMYLTGTLGTAADTLKEGWARVGRTPAMTSPSGTLFWLDPIKEVKKEPKVVMKKRKKIEIK